jgi:hypothetical protein
MQITNFFFKLYLREQIHQFMAGRIKLLKGGVPVSSVDVPVFEYEYDEPGEFDSGCGTFGLDPYVLPHPECLSRFVCTDGSVESSAALFASCIDAMNCAMMVGMTTGYESNDPIALFIHQMVPHHENAVNMAKVCIFSKIQSFADCHQLNVCGISQHYVLLGFTS